MCRAGLQLIIVLEAKGEATKQLGILQRDIYPFTAPTTSATKQAGNLIQNKLKKKEKTV